MFIFPQPLLLQLCLFPYRQLQHNKWAQRAFMGALLGFQFALWAEAKFSASQDDRLDGGQRFDPRRNKLTLCGVTRHLVFLHKLKPTGVFKPAPAEHLHCLQSWCWNESKAIDRCVHIYATDVIPRFPTEMLSLKVELPAAHHKQQHVFKGTAYHFCC